MSRKIAVKADSALWSRVKAKYTRTSRYGGPGWNARKAQLATKEYKDLGGKYRGPKPTTRNNSLTAWTQEDWGYVSPNSHRYLPKAVRKSLTRGERAAETRRKGHSRKHVPYTESVRKKFSRASRKNTRKYV